MIFEGRRELLDGYRSGERSALLEVYRAYVRDVTRFLTFGFSFDSGGQRCRFHGFRGGYEIEAAVQEIFRRAFEEKARLAYNGIDPYRPYLLRIARNAVINDLKARQPILFRFRSGGPVILEPAGDTDPDELGAPERTADEIHEAREVQKLVDRFLATLDERARGVFRLRFEEGLAAEEAGRRLALTRSQVRTTETKLRRDFLRLMHSAGYLTHYRSGLPAGLSAAAIALVAFGGLG